MKGAPYSNKKFNIGKSDINGKGVFASKNFKEGELVGMAVTDEEAVTDTVNFRDARTE